MDDTDEFVVFGAKAIAAVAGGLSIAVILMMGPVDGSRTVYNQIIGDRPYLKRGLIGYCRESIERELPRLEKDSQEEELARRLHAQEYTRGQKLEPDQVSIERLFDYTEDHARSWFDRWIWVPVDD